MSDEQYDWHSEKTYESMITYGLKGIQFVLMVNGASILSILTFLGTHAEKAPKLKYAILWFIAGVTLGGITHLTAYLTQLSLYNERFIEKPQNRMSFYRRHEFWLYLSLFFIVLGIACFFLGSLRTANILGK